VTDQTSSTPTDPRVVKILDRLLKNTQNDEIIWDRGTRGDQCIFSDLKASVTIESADGDGQFPFRVRVLNEDGDLVAGVRFLETSPNGGLAERLFRAARRNALKVDATLDELLSTLGGD